MIIATGPLTSDALSAEIAALVGSQHLYFYDAISPIVLSESIDRTKVFRAPAGAAASGVRSTIRGQTGQVSDRGLTAGARPGPDPVPACGVDDGEGDYLNCPFTRDEYQRFYDALMAAEKAPLHEFDKATFFEGCLPIEVMASRGVDTLRFGPMKPVGLPDPRTGHDAYAIVQLRQDNIAGDHFSLVGFQTQMKWGEQARVLQMIPGLENAEFVRFGMIHRNTYVNSPTVLHETWQTRMRPDAVLRRSDVGRRGLRRVGRVRADCRQECRRARARRAAVGRRRGRPRIGALAYYASHADPKHYVPSNIAFGLIPPLERRVKSKKDRNTAISERALKDLADWLETTSKRFSNISG